MRTAEIKILRTIKGITWEHTG